MTWRVYHDPFNTTIADGSFDVYQKIIPNSNLSITTARAWFVLFNDPTFTALKMRIYNTRDVMLAESTNSISKAYILTDNSGHKEVHFNFDNFAMQSGESYRFRIYATGYTYSTGSYIGWTRGYPDPVYRTNVDLTYTGLLKSPYSMYLIGAEI